MSERPSILAEAAEGKATDFQWTFLDMLGSYPQYASKFGSMCIELEAQGHGKHAVSVASATCQAEIRKMCGVKESDCEILALLFPSN